MDMMMMKIRMIVRKKKSKNYLSRAFVAGRKIIFSRPNKRINRKRFEKIFARIKIFQQNILIRQETANKIPFAGEIHATNAPLEARLNPL